MKIAILYVGSSLLASLRRAEREINEKHDLGVRILAHNCTLPLTDDQWKRSEQDLASADLVFLLHVTDSENSARIVEALERCRQRHHAVIVMNCLGDLMGRLRIGETELSALWKPREGAEARPAARIGRRLASWLSNYAKSRGNGATRNSSAHFRWLRRLPSILRFVPTAGKLEPIKHYLTLFCYFLQPTPANIRSMILYAVKYCLPGSGRRIRVAGPETAPTVGIYHPDAPSLFLSFDRYRRWYERRTLLNQALRLDPDRTAGLLLLRPQIVSGARRHYDGLIRELEGEGLAVLPVLSTFMDNREACRSFFMDPSTKAPRVSQILSLTGFSFVGGPAMNDSRAATAFLKSWNRPLRSALSLEMQTIEDWTGSRIGLNPVQTAMQVAIPEIDGATEPFIYGGLRTGGEEPEPLEDRCRSIARRMARWSELRRLPRSEVRLGLLIFCFPPNLGNLGTAAGLDVFPSVWEILRRLKIEGYRVDAPADPDALREMALETGAGFRLSADDYYKLCPYVEEIEAEWGPAPGQINVQGREILIHGIELGNVFVGVQPTFGYEGDPMKMLMAEGGTPHHGFMGLYTFLDKIFGAHALVHVGTHGALEFMPGKQAGLSGRCWPDRLIGDFPHIYLYSVNNPSEGSIAKRRSYAELISYLTPPVENAGLYKELASLKELINAYRSSRNESQREQLFVNIEEAARRLHLPATGPPPL